MAIGWTDMRKLFLFLALLLVPTLAYGQNWYKNAACTILQSDKIRSGFSSYYCFTDTTDSNLIEVASKTSTLCFDPDLDTEGIATATIYLRWCVGDTKSACMKMFPDLDGGGITPTDDKPLNGDSGVTSEQRSCIYGIPRGKIYVDVQASPGGDDALVKVTGD
jgi:hypothetical protein